MSCNCKQFYEADGGLQINPCEDHATLDEAREEIMRLAKEAVTEIEQGLNEDLVDTARKIQDLGYKIQEAAGNLVEE